MSHFNWNSFFLLRFNMVSIDDSAPIFLLSSFRSKSRPNHQLIHLIRSIFSSALHKCLRSDLMPINCYQTGWSNILFKYKEKNWNNRKIYAPQKKNIVQLNEFNIKIKIIIKKWDHGSNSVEFISIEYNILIEKNFERFKKNSMGRSVIYVQLNIFNRSHIYRYYSRFLLLTISK